MSEIKTIQSKVIKETFKNKEFAEAVSQAIGDNLLRAIRKIDDWNFEHEIKNVLSEAIFSEEFIEELKGYAESFVKDNKDEIKKLVKDNLSVVLTNGIMSASEKIGELLIKRISEVKSIY